MPRFDAPHAVKTFTVNTLTDSGLANPSGTTCVDAAGGKCSIRAGFEAADNLKTAVQLKVPAGVFKLTVGMALYDSDPGGLSVTGAGASKTTIEGDGSGIIYVYPATKTSPSAVLFLTGVTLTHGSDTDGGALYLYYDDSGARAVLNDDALTDNTASGDGGAIDAGGYNSLFMTDTTVTGNHAEYGAAIYAYWSYLDLVNDTISSNSTTTGADGYGGAIYSYYGVLDVTRGSLSSNTAGDATHPGYGGAVEDEGYTDYTFTGVAINNNKATDGGDGGAFYVYYDQLDVTGGSVSHNYVAGTDGSGGAVYVEESSQVGFHGVTLTGNRASGTVAVGEGGGTIYDDVEYYGNAVVIDAGSKITGSNDSAIYLYGYYGGGALRVANSTLSGNTDANDNTEYYGTDESGCGGAICVYSYEYATVAVTLAGDAIDSNSSTGYFTGGAVGIYNWEYTHSSTRLDGDTFRGNVGHGEYDSGALIDEGYYYAPSSLEASGTTFASNSAPYTGYGGAVDAYDYEDYSPIEVTLAGDHFTGNTAGTASGAGYAGALLIYYYATLTDTGSTFSGNRALGTDGEGGAIGEWSYESARLTGTVLTDNSAPGSDSYGGAIYTIDYAGGDSYDGVTISGNSASVGGGVYSGSDGEMQRYVDSTVSGNVALAHTTTPGYGGGLYVDDAVLSATNSTFARNKAESAGAKPGEGGAILEAGPSTNLVYTTVSSNSAGLGGGIYEDGDGGDIMASIVAGNGSKNCSTAGTVDLLSSLGDNVLGSAGCVTSVQPSDKVTSVPGLKALGHNGGPTETMALTSSSPAIDRGGFDCPSTDQRGQPRSATACDAGAYQLAAGKITRISPSRGGGGTVVVISGHGFTFADAVYFGRHKASFHVVSDTLIVAKAPKGRPAGKVDVKVMTPDGFSNVALFTYT